MDNNPLADYLIEDEIINWWHPVVSEQAGQLAQGVEDKVELSRRCFTFVRDRIAHSMDIGAEAVTCSASEVLLTGHGICYAKSHLLAALLRANGIPSGFSYQRLSDENGGYCLHGFNSLYLPSHGWYRVDARGNKAGVDAQFIPPHEQLAFSHSAPGECDYGLNLAAPLPCVVRVLQCSESVQALCDSLPSSIRMG